MKNNWSFFPEWTLWLYLPLHVYIFFQIATQAYPGQQLGYALVPLFLGSVVSGGIVFMFLTFSLFRLFGNRTLKQILLGRLNQGANQVRELHENPEKILPDRKLGGDSESGDKKEFRSTLSDEYSTKPVSEVSDADKWIRGNTKFRWRNVKKILSVFFLVWFLCFLYLNRHLFQLLE